MKEHIFKVKNYIFRICHLLADVIQKARPDFIMSVTWLTYDQLWATIKSSFTREMLITLIYYLILDQKVNHEPINKVRSLGLIKNLVRFEPAAFWL